jgi:nicotinamidase-related amidase
MQFTQDDTGVVFIDPQNDVLSEGGAAWAAVGNSVKENNTIENKWKFNGPLEASEFAEKTFARRGALTLDGFRGSGADWLERFKPYIDDGKTVVVSPHKVWGPQTNDLVLQLRKRRIGKVILGGMLANICVEAHLRDLLEHGFEVCVARDATAGPRHPTWGYEYTAALINFQFLAHTVLSTDEVVRTMERVRSSS